MPTIEVKSGAKPLLLVVAGVVLDRDGRILIAQRPEGKAHAGLWEFPGGKIEPGETPEQALTRELREELLIEPCDHCLQPFSFASFDYPDMHLLMPLFICRQWDGIAKPQDGQAIKWVWPSQLRAIDWVPADVDLASEVSERLKDGSRYVD